MRSAAGATLVLFGLHCGVPHAAAQAASQPGGLAAFEREVQGNILAQPLGAGTVADLIPPPEFLARVARRIIRESFEARFRVVLADGAVPPPAPPPTGTATSVPGELGDLRLYIDTWPDELLAYRRGLREERPGLRGFRAPILDAAGKRPAPQPDPAVDAALRRAQSVVAARLARDGLLTALVFAVEALGPDAVLAEKDPVARLADTGLPVDLLAHFSCDAPPAERPVAHIRTAARRLASGEATEAVRTALGAAAFEFRPTVRGFRIATECGLEPVGRLRLQVTRGDCFQAVGDGSSVDVLRQLVQLAPELPLLVSVEQRFTGPLLEHIRGWRVPGGLKLELVAEPLTVAQWAQDNGKPGRAPLDGRDADLLLVPRYASREEVGAVFVPGESFLADGLACARLAVAQSPLLFQGGNLLAVQAEPGAERVLLVGEAEIYRNSALGLTAAQVESAFRTEFGVDRVLVLPAASFHIDFEVAIRAVGGKLIACVNDEPAATAIVLECGLDALERGGAMPGPVAALARQYLATRKMREFLALAGTAVWNQARGYGQFPESLARHFSTGDADSGPGNFERFLLAMDLATIDATTPAERAGDPNASAYLDILSQQAADRRALRALLERQGWQVRAIPSWSAGRRGINYLNGLADQRRHFVPAWGGLYAPLDAAAIAALRAAWGELPIVGVNCAETQRRDGALRCAVSAHNRASATAWERPKP
jgi:hypothetical protein